MLAMIYFPTFISCSRFRFYYKAQTCTNKHIYSTYVLMRSTATIPTHSKIEVTRDFPERNVSVSPGTTIFVTV
jgi:hypothetical protein